MKKWLQFVYVLSVGLSLTVLTVGCDTADAQGRADSVSIDSEAYLDPGPDGNPVTYDQDPDNPPLEVPQTYINADGREVQNPTGYNETPLDPSAICRNGQYSFSKRRCGTCSGNGGVREWLKDLPSCN